MTEYKVIKAFAVANIKKTNDNGSFNYVPVIETADNIIRNPHNIAGGIDGHVQFFIQVVNSQGVIEYSRTSPHGRDEIMYAGDFVSIMGKTKSLSGNNKIGTNKIRENVHSNDIANLAEDILRVANLEWKVFARGDTIKWVADGICSHGVKGERVMSIMAIGKQCEDTDNGLYHPSYKKLQKLIAEI